MSILLCCVLNHFTGSKSSPDQFCHKKSRDSSKLMTSADLHDLIIVAALVRIENDILFVDQLFFAIH